MRILFDRLKVQFWHLLLLLWWIIQNDHLIEIQLIDGAHLDCEVLCSILFLLLIFLWHAEAGD